MEIATTIKYPEGYLPEKPDIMKNYAVLSQIYAHPLSPTIVTLVQDLKANKQCISKSIIKKKLMSPEQLESAKRECTIHSAMKHPNIIQMYEYTETEEDIRLYMEYANMPDYLEDKIIERLNPVKSQPKLVRYVKEIVEGIEYVHKRGIVHCDMKLANIFAYKGPDPENSEVHLKVSDFGLALIIDPKTHKAYMPLKAGTFNYLAPEVKNGAFVDTAVDIWSLGVLFYEMCVGYRPTDWGGYKYGSGPVPFPKRDWKSVSPHAQDMISRCLQTEPEKRITATEILAHPWLSNP